MIKPVVIDRPKHDRNINTEPEMIELKRMIRSGELSAGRVVESTMEGTYTMKTQTQTPVKQLTLRVPPEVHKALKVRAAEEETTVGVLVEGLIRAYLVKGQS